MIDNFPRALFGSSPLRFPHLVHTLLQRLLSNKQKHFIQVNVNTIAVVFPRDCLGNQQTNQNASFPCKDLSRIISEFKGWGGTGIKKPIILLHFHGSCCVAGVPQGIKSVLKTKNQKALSNSCS